MDIMQTLLIGYTTTVVDWGNIENGIYDNDLKDTSDKQYPFES